MTTSQEHLLACVAGLEKLTGEKQTPYDFMQLEAGAANHPSGGYHEPVQPSTHQLSSASMFSSMIGQIKQTQEYFPQMVKEAKKQFHTEEANLGSRYTVGELKAMLLVWEGAVDGDGMPRPEPDALRELIAEYETTAKVKPAKEPKEPKAKKEKAAPLVPEGIVLYTDAGTKPNPGYGGWGIHGYVYNNAAPKKGTGNPLVKLTAEGYVLKEVDDEYDTAAAVTPLTYVDGVGSIPHCSNNGGEVAAMGQGLEYALKFDLKRVNLYSDSQYAIQNLAYVPTWREQNWIKRDGTPIRNVPFWEATRGAFDALVAKGVDVQIRWVKGHNGNLGNTTVDRYATMGREASAAGTHCQMIESSEPDGYWAGEERHPFLYHKHTYFTSHPDFNVVGEYYLGDHGKEANGSAGTILLGKRNADATYAFVRLKTPDELIEIVRRNMLRLADRNDALLLASVDQIYTAACSRDLKRFNEHALKRSSKHKIDLSYYDDEPVMTELQPPRLAMRAIEAVNHLKGLLTTFEAGGDATLIKTDLTERLFQDDKGKLKLTDELGAGVSTLKVLASYAKADAQAGAEIEVGTTELSLVLGVDLPERNALKRLEKSHPKVTLVTWREATAVRHATVVECDEGIGIWAGYYANTKYLKPSAEDKA